VKNYYTHKNRHHQLLARIWSTRNSNSLLMEIQSIKWYGTLEVSYNAKHSFTMQFCHFFLRYLPNWLKTCLCKILYTNVHGSFVHNLHKPETTKMFLNKWMNKLTGAHLPMDYLLFSDKNICTSLSEISKTKSLYSTWFPLYDNLE
jgi:hypothetical protein